MSKDSYFAKGIITVDVRDKISVKEIFYQLEDIEEKQNGRDEKMLLIIKNCQDLKPNGCEQYNIKNFVEFYKNVQLLMIGEYKGDISRKSHKVEIEQNNINNEEREKKAIKGWTWEFVKWNKSGDTGSLYKNKNN